MLRNILSYLCACARFPTRAYDKPFKAIYVLARVSQCVHMKNHLKAATNATQYSKLFMCLRAFPNACI
jgi:hypothetical protein